MQNCKWQSSCIKSEAKDLHSNPTQHRLSRDQLDNPVALLGMHCATSNQYRSLSASQPSARCVRKVRLVEPASPSDRVVDPSIVRTARTLSSSWGPYVTNEVSMHQA
jgi:hypothetical protein